MKDHNRRPQKTSLQAVSSPAAAAASDFSGLVEERQEVDQMLAIDTRTTMDSTSLGVGTGWSEIRWI